MKPKLVDINSFKDKLMKRYNTSKISLKENIDVSSKNLYKNYSNTMVIAVLFIGICLLYYKYQEKTSKKTYVY